MKTGPWRSIFPEIEAEQTNIIYRHLLPLLVINAIVAIAPVFALQYPS